MCAVLTILLLLALIIAYSVHPGRRPLPTESDLSHKFPLWFFPYYSSKYFSPVYLPVKKSTETLFAETAFKEPAPLQHSRKVTMTAVGDLMVRKDLAAPQSRRLWDGVAKELFSADYVMGNLEFAVNPDKIHNQIIRYSVTHDRAQQFMEPSMPGRFDAFFIANNHINDSGHDGIVSTCRYLDEQGFVHTGASKTPEELDEFPIVEVNGIKFALLSYTFSTNNRPMENEYGVNLIRFNALRDKDYDPSLIYRHIELAKQRGADFIISSHHWGIEFETYPSERLIARAHDLMDRGIDLIIGHHPHILNMNEVYQTKDGRQAACFYSLGSLTTYALKAAIHQLAAIAEFEVEQGVNDQNETVTRISRILITPTFFLKKWNDGSADHQIVPLLSTCEDLRRGENRYNLNSRLKSDMLKTEKLFEKHLRQTGFQYR